MAEHLLATLAILLVQLLQFFLRQVLDGGNLIFGPLDRNDQFGKLELDRERVPVLGVLNEKHHEKSHDRVEVLMTSCQVSL